ncbi:hypothetical protein EV176_002438 [Coemansia sp. RSA 451]|nr:hypothetical protein EV176_002438 [Coemansia sp. RSA 451]
MKCGVCKGGTGRGYCGACVQDRMCQHEWLSNVVQERTAQVAQSGWTADRAQQLYEYQTRRLQARQARVAELKARIHEREQQIAAARQWYRELSESNKRNSVQQLESNTGLSTKQEAREQSHATQSALERVETTATALRADRLVLTSALCTVVGLRTVETDVFAGVDERARLFGLPWPGIDDWRKFPADYINACVSHSVHIFSVLSNYLHLQTPFAVVKRGSRLFIRPNWRQVDVREAALSIDDDRASFVVGLAMLFYNIAFMCHRQGVRVPVEQVADAVENMRLAVLAQAEPENTARTRLPFALDIYTVVQEVMRMYADPAHPDADLELRSRVHDELRRLHLCDDAVDSVDYEDDNWAII